MSSSSEQPVQAVPNPVQAVPHPIGSDQQNSLMLQVSSQERRIAELSKSLDERNGQLVKFQSEKKAEMEALLTGMKSWLSNLDIKSETHRKEFDNGLDRLVEKSMFDNGMYEPLPFACKSFYCIHESK
jgi:hypothetical protein